MPEGMSPPIFVILCALLGGIIGWLVGLLIVVLNWVYR